MTTPQPSPAGDLPLEAAARLAAIRRGLPAGWAVARIWPGAGGGWVAGLADESGQVMAQVIVWPLQGGATEQET